VTAGQERPRVAAYSKRRCNSRRAHLWAI